MSVYLWNYLFYFTSLPGFFKALGLLKFVFKVASGVATASSQRQCPRRARWLAGTTRTSLTRPKSSRNSYSRSHSILNAANFDVSAKLTVCCAGWHVGPFVRKRKAQFYLARSAKSRIVDIPCSSGWLFYRKGSRLLVLCFRRMRQHTYSVILLTSSCQRHSRSAFRFTTRCIKCLIVCSVFEYVLPLTDNSHERHMYVAFGTCEHPEHSNMVFHWTLFPDKNYMQVGQHRAKWFSCMIHFDGRVQLQLLSADGTTFFALAAHREVQLSFLQKYGFVLTFCSAYTCEC